jgi:hypothetical protein
LGRQSVALKVPAARMQSNRPLIKRSKSSNRKGPLDWKRSAKYVSYNGNDVFVNDLNGKNRMHIKEKLIGKGPIGLKDDTGKRFFAACTEATKTKPALLAIKSVIRIKRCYP